MFGLNKDKEDALRKFVVMYKFEHEDRFQLEKCFNKQTRSILWRRCRRNTIFTRY